MFRFNITVQTIDTKVISIIQFQILAAAVISRVQYLYNFLSQINNLKVKKENVADFKLTFLMNMTELG